MLAPLARLGAVLLLLLFAPVAHAQTAATSEAAKAASETGTSGTSGGGQDASGARPETNSSAPNVQGTIEVHPSPVPTQGPAPVNALVRPNVQVIPARPTTQKSQDLKCLCTDPATNERKCDLACCTEQDHSVCEEP